ncbi:MAG TPA: V-type ATP synthase subunit F [Bryobacteraceae bacterium]|nr:V-type ATP synthase subunit F [Bryobacteraceae bacterium]
MPGQKIVVIGDEDAVFGLGLIGFQGQTVATLDEARKAVESALADPETGLILLTENWSEAREEALEDPGAPVVEIPGPQPPAKPSMALETRIERALGVHLER